MRKIIMTLLAAVFAVCALAKEYGIADIPNVQLQHYSKSLSDPDGIVGEAIGAEVDSALLDIRRKTTAEVAVVVVGDIDTDDADGFATTLFEHWGVGKKGKHNGVLMLVVKDKKRVVIRTGYGAEGILPDIICGRIIRVQMQDKMREGKYGEGVLEAVKEIQRLMENPDVVAELIEEENGGGGDGGLLYWLFGGMAGLGGAAYGVPKYMRNRKRKCEKCKKQMRKAEGEERLSALNEKQKWEEEFGTAEYDVWVCDGCGEKVVRKYGGKKAGYEECPKCHTRAMKADREEILTEPTTESKGEKKRYCHCEHCGEAIVMTVAIAALRSATRRRENEDRPRDESGSFGGGKTGGGGALGGW